MKFTIKHEARGRMRIHLVQYRMSYAQADLLLYYLHTQPQVKEAKVYERTGDAVVVYTGDRQQIIDLLLAFAYEEVKAPTGADRKFRKSVKCRLSGKTGRPCGKALCDQMAASAATPFLLCHLAVTEVYERRSEDTSERKDRGTGAGCDSDCGICFKK